MSLQDRVVVLGVSGGIAAYKAAELVRQLRKAGARVRPLLTRGGAQFVTPLTLQTLAGEPVATDLFDLTQESQIGHIQLADSADALVIAPATANVVGKLAAGIADDLLSTVAIATRAPVLLAPAMNVNMWRSAVVQENLARLRARGVRVLDPDAGLLACGYEGEGRLPDPERIVEAIRELLSRADLAGEHVLVTSGPTREALDPVRFLSNRSSGKMGHAIARAARRRGARVTLVSGPVAIADPSGVEVVRVESALQMAAAVEARMPEVSLLVAAAAVADYQPRVRSAEKSPKVRGELTLELEPTPDVVGSAPRPRSDLLVIGFAAETSEVLSRAAGKLDRKRLDLVVANDVGAEGAGFDVDTNVVTLVDRQGATPLPRMPKDDVADAILDRVVGLRAARPLRPIV